MATLGLGQAIYEDVAVAAVDAAVVAPAWIFVNGFINPAPTRVGAGIYDLFFPALVPVANTICDITNREDGNLGPSYVVAPDGSKVTVFLLNGLGAPKDIDFSITVKTIFPLT